MSGLRTPAILIAITGYARNEDRERAKAAGFTAHLAINRVSELHRVLTEIVAHW